MTDELGPIHVVRKQGDEPFRRRGGNFGVSLLDYWQWAVSDVIGNTERGNIAEFIVAMDFGVIDDVRNTYVFCVLANKDQETIDSPDIDQWEFYVSGTHVLDEKLGEQKTVGLAKLLKLGARKTVFGEIAATVRDVAVT